MLTFVVGYRTILSALNAQERLLDQSRREAAMLKRENELASRTHDTVTGTLSSIILLSEQQRDDSHDPAQVEAWNIVNQASTKALDNLHQVIDILGGDSVEDYRLQPVSHSDEQRIENLAWRLNRTIAENDYRLHVLGFPGDTDIHGAYDGDGGLGGVETERLLHELYDNIRDHASHDTRYHMSITLDASAVRIVQINGICEEISGSSRMPRSGRGLRLHRKLIERLDGTLTTNIDGMRWKLEAYIPLVVTPSQE